MSVLNIRFFLIFQFLLFEIILHIRMCSSWGFHQFSAALWPLNTHVPHWGVKNLKMRVFLMCRFVKRLVLHWPDCPVGAQRQDEQRKVALEGERWLPQRTTLHWSCWLGEGGAGGFLVYADITILQSVQTDCQKVFWTFPASESPAQPRENGGTQDSSFTSNTGGRQAAGLR